MFRRFSNFSSPNDSPGITPPIEEKSLGKDEVIDYFTSEEDDQETETIDLKSDKTDKPKKESSEIELDTTEEKEKTLEDEIETELNEEEIDDEKLELTTPVRRREILAKYPALFKDFPYLEKAYYREQKYSEILPTIEDAQAAAEKAGLLDQYGTELGDGSAKGIIKAVKDGNPEAFAKLVDNYLPDLHAIDESAYYHVVGNIVKHTVQTMISQGKNSNQEDLITAANIVNEFIFGTKELQPINRLSKTDDKPNEREEQSTKKEEEFNKRQFEAASNDLENRVSNILTSTIDKNIDPNDSMTSYVKRNATREVIENLEISIKQDSRFQVILDKLWNKAKLDDYDKDSMDRIKSAYLSKAKSILPIVIKKARNEALKGLGKKVQDGDDDDRVKRGPLPVGKTRNSTSAPATKEAAKSIPRNVSTLDFLNQD